MTDDDLKVLGPVVEKLIARITSGKSKVFVSDVTTTYVKGTLPYVREARVDLVTYTITLPKKKFVTIGSALDRVVKTRGFFSKRVIEEEINPYFITRLFENPRLPLDVLVVHNYSFLYLEIETLYKLCADKIKEKEDVEFQKHKAKAEKEEKALRRKVEKFLEDI